MRLNKYIAQAGIASRRGADELIKNGNVRINGRTVSTLGYDVGDEDEVFVNGVRAVVSARSVYILLNKPKGFITTVKDERGRATVMDLIGDIPERVFPVGRLDSATTGLLILTNDGEFANKLTHPGHEVYKTYRAKVSGIISNQRIARLKKGVDIGGYVTAPADVKLVRQGAKSAVVEISIREGKNQQVRKMFAEVGNKVLELERISIGEVRLGNLMSGHYRKMKRQEIDCLLR
jgi:23S rRNA pseudouridine2605 synthase